jgi:hypothetical protein
MATPLAAELAACIHHWKGRSYRAAPLATERGFIAVAFEAFAVAFAAAWSLVRRMPATWTAMPLLPDRGDGSDLRRMWQRLPCVAASVPPDACRRRAVIDGR